MQNRDAFFFRAFTVASVHTVVRPVVPLTWEHIETLCQRRPGETGRGGKDTSDELQQIKPCFCEKAGTEELYKFQLLLLQISQAAARHRSFLSSGHDYTYLSAVRPELPEREGNTKTGCKHKPREHFTKLKVTKSTPKYAPGGTTQGPRP